MDWTNLHVRAWLRTGVISDPWLPLDGMLFYQSVRDDLGRQDITTPGLSSLARPKGEPMSGTKLPLKVVHAREWFYRCSWAQWGPYADGKDYWNKRLDVSFADLVDFKGRRGRVIIESSRYKAYHMPIFYRAALWIDWYCVGNRERIEYLVSTLTHIGKKNAQGWGRIVRWEIEPIAEDWSIWRDGRLMRGVPMKYLAPSDGRGKNDSVPADCRMAYYGLRPSYWDRRNQLSLVLPPNG